MNVDSSSEAFSSRAQNSAFLQKTRGAGFSGPALLTGMLINIVLSLSVHVIMFQVFNVPYPDDSGASRWATSLNAVCSILALAVFYNLARPKLARFSLFLQGLIVSALYAMVREMVRIIVMESIVTTAYAHYLVGGIPTVLYYLVAGCLTVLVVSKIQGLWWKVVGVGALANILVFAIHPLLTSLFAPLLKTYPDHADMYTGALGWQVLLPAYLLYAEAVAGCMILAALVWPRLSSAPVVRFLQFTLIMMFIKGEALRGTLYSIYVPFKLPLAFLSESQFLLQWLMLSLLTVLTWQLSQRSQS